MTQRDESARGLRNKGNRIGLGVLVGFVAQIFAGLLGAGFGIRVVVWAGVAAIVYAIATPRS